MQRTMLLDPLSSPVEKLRHHGRRRRLARWVGGHALATLALGTALSVGGVTDVLQGISSLVRGDADTALHDSSTSPLFRVSSVLPEAASQQRVSMFAERWLLPSAAPEARRDVFDEEMARINDAIRREFFSSAVPFGGIIHDKAEKYDVDPALVAAVMETESDFQNRAVSPVGARGLMQIMPSTGRWLGARNLYDPEENVDAGVRYLKYLQERFDGNLKMTLAAYNAGEGNVMRYGGIPPFRETRSYVKNVLNRYQKRRRQLEQYGARRQSAEPAEVAFGR